MRLINRLYSVQAIFSRVVRSSRNGIRPGRNLRANIELKLFIFSRVAYNCPIVPI